MGAPNGDSRRARSRSTWIHWWSPVASANRTMSSNAIVRHSDLPSSLPTSASSPGIPSITVLAMREAISRGPYARSDEQALRRATERSFEIRQCALRQSRSVGVRLGDDGKADPLAARLAAEIDGEVGIEEGPLRWIERRADAALRVGEDEHPFVRRGPLALDERMERLHPGIDRAFRPDTARDPHLDRAVVRVGVTEVREAERWERIGVGLRCGRERHATVRR